MEGIGIGTSTGTAAAAAIVGTAATAATATAEIVPQAEQPTIATATHAATLHRGSLFLSPPFSVLVLSFAAFYFPSSFVCRRFEFFGLR